MTNPPSRTADKIIIRLPDGMRERLHARAEANGRSMTAEVVAMLEHVLDAPADKELEALAYESLRLDDELRRIFEQTDRLVKRQNIVEQELRARIGKDIAGERPHEYALRVHLQSKSRARKDTERKAFD